MAALEKMAKLVEKLQEKTVHDEMDWNETFTNRYTALINKVNVFVSVNFPPYESEDDPDYLFGFEDKAGTPIDFVSDVDLRTFLPNSYKVMKSLYEGARRNARGVERLVDDVTKALDDEL